MAGAIAVVVNEHWQQLERSSPPLPGALRVAELPVSAGQRPLAAAVDDEGNRHLLIPTDSYQRVRKGLDGPALRLRKTVLEDSGNRDYFVSLCCMRSDIHPIFTMLCADILVAVEGAPENPIKQLNLVLDRWRALFLSPGSLLGPQQLSGLFGELRVLARLLEENGTAHHLWLGPKGYRHDFSTDRAALEVKTSVEGNGRVVRVHGLEQLEPPTDGTLGLVWLRLRQATASGTGLVELVNRVLELADDEAAVLDLLGSVGYRVADNEHYEHVRFTVEEERWYNVDIAFPKLTRVNLVASSASANVRDVDYTIDLGVEPPKPMDESDIEQCLAAMLEEQV
ncbi:PD-(D/E)XK motif protein [Nocardia testacea]|uniref:PD-(D/E)XK motif protein n=1 Tax=Nocardia testacea TaxID=248551 RepID=UPI003C2C2608